ncbi:MAG: SH3 domain-containing protein [Methyloceanibacter sp.]|uniref:SH3 domain-containing protein n=1 Tax=Methyloceanibacter sp. TaxID=1965321 RepID=UPI003EE22527
MVQPALRSVQVPEQPKPITLAERLDAEFPVGAKLSATKPEHTVSSMAERFAPGPLRATRPVPIPALAAHAALVTPPQDPGLFSTPTRGVVAVLTAVAIAPAGILAGLLWFGTLPPDASPKAGAAAPAQAQQAAVAPSIPVLISEPEIALTAPEEILAKAGETIDFAIAIDGGEALPARSAIAIRDLPEGASFSKGRPFGTSEWNLRADEIADLTLRLPQDETGASDLRVELVAADGAVLARTATRLDVAPPPTAGLVVRSGEEDRIADLMAHGQKMIDVGYFAGARAYYQRAAEAGSGEAALAVGATYDPAFVSALRAQGIKPDRQAAEAWYSRAAALGVADREAGLAALKQAWTGDGARAIEAALSGPEEAAPAPLAQPRAAQEQDAEDSGPLGRLVAAASELAAGVEWVEVTNAVNLRADSSGDGKVLKVVQKGTKFRSTGRDGNWVQVSNPATSEEGWIYTRFLKETNAP